MIMLVVVLCFAHSRHLPCVFSTQDKPGKHLPYESPKLQRVRDYVQWAVTEGGVHERLVMNFDQVYPATGWLDRDSVLRTIADCLDLP